MIHSLLKAIPGSQSTKVSGACVEQKVCVASIFPKSLTACCGQVAIGTFLLMSVAAVPIYLKGELMA